MLSSQIHLEQISAFNRWNGLRISPGLASTIGGKRPALVFKDSHAFRDRDCQSLGVDISVYSGQGIIKRKTEQTMDFANLDTWIQLKPNASWDAFDDADAVDQTKTYLEEVSEKRQNEGGRVETEHEDEVGDEAEDEGDSDEQDIDIAEDDPNGTGQRREVPRDPSGPAPVSFSMTRDDARSYPFEKNTVNGCSTRAQLAAYAGATMATQYRNHLFTVVITGNLARLIRWDRASAVVTHAFDYVARPLVIFEYFKRLRQLTREARGWNVHVKPATVSEADKARQALRTLAPELWLGLAGQQFVKMIDIDTQPFLKVDFDGQLFIVPAPHCSERGLLPFGRCSRGSAAYDIKRRKICFLKDGWRDLHRSSEADIYRRLNGCGVNYVATMTCGGDWGNSTLGHRIAKRTWVNKAAGLRLRQLTHHIIVLDVVGRGLIAFSTAYQLLSCLADGMEGMSRLISSSSRADTTNYQATKKL